MKRKLTKKLLEEFERYMYENEKSNATIEKYMRDVSKFSKFANGRGISKTLVLEYKTELGRVYALTSANSMIAAVNAFLRFAGWFDCCIKQFKIQREMYCSEKKELSKIEYLTLVETAEKQKNIRLSLLIQTICGTGIRVSELKYITVEAAYSGEAIVSCKGKTRRVFIVPVLRKKLLNYARNQGIMSGMIFLTKTGKAMDRSNIWLAMKKICKDAGVSPKKVFPHNLRHLFARTFYGIERDISKLADILGHSSINTTRIYTISTGEEHRQKMENMRLII
jgi:site-specific recombinase XerD